MINKIATVALYVDDQQKTKAFWTKKVGFEIKAEHTMGGDSTWLEIGPVESNTALVIYPKSMMENWKELQPSIVFECEDIQATYETMNNNGVVFPMEPKNMGFGIFAQFIDDDGHTFGLRE